MAVKQLKSVSAPLDINPPPQPQRRPADVETLRRVAADAGRSLPPAIVNSASRSVLINVKVTEDLAIALAARADAEGCTQKQIIMRALAAVGLPVDPVDLEDRSRRRRRG